MKYLFTSVVGKMCKYDHWEDLNEVGKQRKQGLLTTQDVFQSEVRRHHLDQNHLGCLLNCSFSDIAPSNVSEDLGSCILNELPRFSSIVKLENRCLSSLPSHVSSVSTFIHCSLSGHFP